MTDASELLTGLSPQQRRAATALHGPVVILAGAGAGKTSTITRRIAYGIATGVYSEPRTLAITFTTRAAGELRSRLRALGVGQVPARTIHSAALAQLAHFWPQVIGGSAPRVLETKARLLADAARGIGIRADDALLRAVAAEIEWRKVSCLSIAEYADAERILPQGLAMDAMLALQQGYESLKDDLRRIDFEDVLLATAGMLEAEPGVAAAVRERYRTFTVDEAQDISPVQELLLKLWLGNRSDLCVVGDPNQTIYGFAGASASFLMRFAREHQNAEVVRLSENHRSTTEIVEFANRAVAGQPGAMKQTATGEDAHLGEAPQLFQFVDEREEAKAIAAAVLADLADGIAPAQIAILVRMNAQIRPIEQALQDAGVPVASRDEVRFFERAEVRSAIVHLLASKRTAPAGQPLTVTVRGVLSTLGWSPAEPSSVANLEAWRSLNALVTLAEEWGDEAGLGEYLDDLLERQSSRNPPITEAVTIATIHSAKGLEWDSVHLAGVADGILPLAQSSTAQQLDEERRLFYVALTRARRRLRITQPGNRRSRFLP